MTITDQKELEELTNSISTLIQENRKFLEKVLDEGFEPEEESEEDTADDFEEL
jgi:hypothetical protein